MNSSRGMFPIALMILVVFSIVFFAFHGLTFAPTRNDPVKKLPQNLKHNFQPQQHQQHEHDDDKDATASPALSPQHHHHHHHLVAVDNILECPASTPHFEVNPPVMPAEFLDEMKCKAHKINKKKWPHIPHQIDLERCGRETPECAFWSCVSTTTQNSTSSSSSSSAVDPAHRKCCHEHRALRDVAHWVIDRLEENNIRYFLSTGTALGAIRHNGVIIPWDTDVDMVIFPNDTERVKTLFKRHSKKHYFHKDRLGKKMFWVHASKNGHPPDGPHVEIFYEKDYTRHLDELLPLERCDFYGKRVWCPSRNMFGIWFPSGWKKYSGAHYHDDGRCTIYYSCTGKRVD